VLEKFVEVVEEVDAPLPPRRFREVASANVHVKHVHVDADVKNVGVLENRKLNII